MKGMKGSKMEQRSAGELRAGIAGEATRAVTKENTAVAMGSGDVAVFATPAMVALMEEAAVAALAPYLAEGQTSVGVHVEVRHLAATPVGAQVRAVARLMLVEGRRVIFRVLAYDDKESIGEGQHERMIVDRARFLDRALGKK
jgi:predicted thioesterase